MIARWHLHVPLALLLTTADATLSLNPTAKCAQLPTTKPPRPTPTPDALIHLLPDPDTRENFFDTFQAAHLRVEHAYRPDAPAWRRLYEAFLPDTLDALLAHNASLSGGPLQLHADVTLRRPGETPAGWRHHTVATLNPLSSGRARRAVGLQQAKAAVRDGFELVVHALHHRVRAVARFCDGLSAFFGVLTTADLHFLPPRQPEGSPSPDVFAGDIFVVLLDGALAVRLFADLRPFAADDELADDAVVAGIGDAAAAVSPTLIDLRPGDVLYIPRGHGVLTRAPRAASFVKFHVRTDTLTAARGLATFVATARITRDVSPLERPLPGAEYLPYARLVTASIDIATAFTPPMRKFLPLAPGVASAREDAGETAADVVADVVARFAGAAHALFKPAMEVLAGEGGDDVDEGVAEWARSAVALGGDVLKVAEKGFLDAVEWLASRDVAEDCVTKVTLEWFEERRNEERVSHAQRENCLERHGQGL